VFVVCCLGNDLCDGLITRSEESYRVCVCVCACIIVCELETSTMKQHTLDVGCGDMNKKPASTDPY
jgi:hypothetical protein